MLLQWDFKHLSISMMDCCEDIRRIKVPLFAKFLRPSPSPNRLFTSSLLFVRPHLQTTKDIINNLRLR